MDVLFALSNCYRLSCEASKSLRAKYLAHLTISFLASAIELVREITYRKRKRESQSFLFIRAS